MTQGANLKEFHIVIMQLKPKIRTIPADFSKCQNQSCHNEFYNEVKQSEFYTIIFKKLWKEY